MSMFSYSGKWYWQGTAMCNRVDLMNNKRCVLDEGHWHHCEMVEMVDNPTLMISRAAEARSRRYEQSPDVDMSYVEMAAR